ncbi:MAG TPA: hypothetical protein VMF57_15520 [Solirubrobacteraceae bacterium]|nr:hypothetical protein [Solirubrobacteraceae bacterium]
MSTTETERTVELPAATEYESCEHCGSPVEAAQRYCVVCGARRKHVYDPAARFLSQATGQTRTSRGTRSSPRSPRRTAGLGLVLALVAIPLAVAVGVLIARSGNNVNSKLLAALRAEKPPVVNVNGGAAASGAPAGSTTTAAASTQVARLTSTFGLQKGYAVELETLPGAGTTQAAVSAAEAKARGHGATAVGLISQSDFKVTPAPPAGDYVIYSGQYTSSVGANSALAKLKHAFPSARVIEVRSTSAATASSTPVLSSTQYGSAHAVTGYKPSSSQLSQGAQIVKQESQETNGNYTKSQQGLPDAISVP